VVSASPRSGRVDRHIEFLGLVYQLWAAFNGILGLSLALFAASAALLMITPDGLPAAEIAAGVTAAGFAIVAGAAVVWAVVHAWCGAALRRHDSRARLLALTLAVLNAVRFPLGTLLALYTAWVLLQDEVRSRFER
jgi:hypothetical protein